MWLGNEQIQESKYLWGAPFVKIDVIEETIWRFFTFVLLFVSHSMYPRKLSTMELKIIKPGVDKTCLGKLRQ